MWLLTQRYVLSKTSWALIQFEWLFQFTWVPAWITTVLMRRTKLPLHSWVCKLYFAACWKIGKNATTTTKRSDKMQLMCKWNFFFNSGWRVEPDSQGQKTGWVGLVPQSCKQGRVGLAPRVRGAGQGGGSGWSGSFGSTNSSYLFTYREKRRVWGGLLANNNLGFLKITIPSSLNSTSVPVRHTYFLISCLILLQLCIWA